MELQSAAPGRAEAHSTCQDVLRVWVSWHALYSRSTCAIGNSGAGAIFQCVHRRPRPRLTGRVKEWAISCAVAVQIRVDGALRGSPLASLEGINRSDGPISQNILCGPVAVLEGLHLIQQGYGHSIPVIQNRIRTIGRKIQPILCAARSEHGTEHVSSRVVDGLAEGVRTNELQAMAESFGHLSCQSVIRGRCPRFKRNQV